MRDSGSPTGLLTVLVRLRQCLVDSPLRLNAADAAEGARARSSILTQLDDYVMPRLVQVEAPLLAVVGGSTGAGKSTLVNSLLEQVVTHPGVLRPTTRSAMLIHNPADAHWFGADRLLPDLERIDHVTGDPHALHLQALETMPVGLALLDAPDVDSVERANRVLASQLLGAADLWLFVTSAARYADQVPWDYLKAAASRSAAVAVVLDRTDASVMREVSSHLARMMDARGLGDARLFTVAESPLSADGLLDRETVRPIRDWLDGLAADASARAGVVRTTLQGAIASLPGRTSQVATALSTQEQLASLLRAEVTAAYGEALVAVDAATRDGTMLRGDVVSRWQEFVGTGEMLRGVETRVGTVRGSAAKGNVVPAQPVIVAVGSGLHTLVLGYAETAADRVALAWRSLPAGNQLLEASPEPLSGASTGAPAEIERAIRDWQGAVLDLVRSEGVDQRSSAPFLASGVNGIGVALMLAALASTPGATGAEIGVAGGTAVAAQKILETVFGDLAVRGLAERARMDLLTRIQALWAAEQARFLAVLDGHQVAPGSSERLRALGHELSDARYAWEQA